MESMTMIKLTKIYRTIYNADDFVLVEKFN